MVLGLLLRRACACLCVGAVGLVFGVAASTAAGAAVSAASFESAAVRESIKHELGQEPGPLGVSQGGSGGSAEPQAPAGGELVSSLSTAYSDTWQVPHEPLVSRIYASPVNFKGSDGAWHAIEDQLVPAALGGYENAANSFSLRFGMSLSTGVSLADGGSSVSFALQGAAEAMPTVSGSAASYREALPSTDFEYESNSTGVDETATLKDTGAPEALRFALSASAGLEARSESSGAVVLVDGHGQVAFRIPAALAYVQSEGPDVSHQLTSTLSKTASGWVWSVDTSAAWLRSALASGAVVVDPTVEVAGSQNCTIESDLPKSSSCTAESFEVGYHSEAPAHEHHGLLQFSLSSLPTDANILNAKLGLYLQSKSTSTTKPVGVYRVTKPWTTGATWETYDGTHAWTTAGGDYANPAENSDVSLNPSVGGSTGWAYWYPTKMVQKWANGTNAPEREGRTEGAENDGLIVKDETDNSINNVLTFSSIHATSHQPFLEVSYEQRAIGRESQYTYLDYPITTELSAGVNVASGNLALQNQDLNIRGVGESFSSARTYNSLDPDVRDYGYWNDSNFLELKEYSDGSMLFTDPSDAYFPFIKKSDGTYITPPGIKATFCTAGHAPCPTTLPSGVSYRLIYNQSQSHIDFTSFGWSVKQADRHGNVLTAGLTEGVGAITSWTDTEGRKITYSDAAEGYTEIKDVSGARHISYEYEGKGSGAQLIGVTDAAGHKTKYTYEFGLLSKITTPDGHVTHFYYASGKRIEYIVRTDNAEHTAGPTTQFTYYEVGQTGNPCGTTSKQRATVVADPDGFTEREEGKAKSEKSHTTTYCSNVLDQVEKVIDGDGHEAKSTFDPFGNTISTTAPARESGGSQGVTSLVYGAEGQNLGCEVQGTTSSSPCPGKAMAKGYATEAKYEDTTFKYQPSTTISERQKSTNLCYWSGSNACKEESTGETGAEGELKQQNLPLTGSKALKYAYNTNGTVSSSTDADGNKTSYEYDEKGNLKTITPPSGSGLGKTTITVDALSRPHIVTQCLKESGGTCTSSETSTLTYDNLDRVTEAVDTGPGATKTFKYTFDADGNLEKREDPTGTTKYTYDPLNRLTEESLPGSLKNAYTYDEANNLMSFTDSGGTSYYFYNALSQVYAMYEPGGNCGKEPSKCTEASYDNGGSLTKITYPSKATLNYTVDPTTGRPTVITAKNATGETLLSHTYTYLEGTNDTPLIYKDVYSQPGTATNTTEYEYNPLDRLEKAITTGTSPSYYKYVLDAAGNRTSQNVNTAKAEAGTETFYRYNPGNELECRMKTNEPCSKTSTSEISGYTYDGAGNETTITGYNDPASTTFAYNNLNQLKTLTPPSLTEEGATYLGSGQSELTGLGASTLQNSLLGVTKQTTGVGTSYYARTPQGLLVDERLPGSTSYNPVYDAQGDVVGLLSSTGALAQTVRYGPYGENTNAAGTVAYSSTNDPFLYQGGYHVSGGNAGSGNVPNNLYHYGARYYDPTTGRWTQQDPRAVDSYDFADGSPIDGIDPSGELLDTLLEYAGKYLHAGEHFIFSNTLARNARIGSVLKLVGKIFKVVSIANFADECANKLTGGGLEEQDPGSCNVLHLVIP
jgi:RHS repeat-associated protein